MNIFLRTVEWNGMEIEPAKAGLWRCQGEGSEGLRRSLILEGFHNRDRNLTEMI